LLLLLIALFALLLAMLTTMLFGLIGDATISADVELLFDKLFIGSDGFEFERLNEHDDDDVAEMAVEIVVDLLHAVALFSWCWWLLPINN